MCWKLLASLVDKSLAMLDEHENGGRYGMLETIRDYARDKLERDSELDAIAVRHCEHYFAMVKAANYGMRGKDQAEWIRRLEGDLDNVRSSIRLALNGGVDPIIAVKIAVALQDFWRLRGYVSEGRNLVCAALAEDAIQTSDLAKAWALYVGAALAESQSDHDEARQMLEQCLALRRRLGNPIEVAATLSTLSLAQLRAGDAVAAAEGEREALRIFRETGDRRGEAISLLHLAQVAFYTGTDTEASSNLEQCLAIARDIRHQELEGECELQSGEISFWLGETDQAVLWFKRSLTLCREAADKRGEANALRWLGKCDLRKRDRASARTRLTDALRAFRSFEMWDELLACLEDFAELCQLEGRPKSVDPALGGDAASSRATGS